MATRWNLESIYPSADADELWERDFAQLVQQGDNNIPAEVKEILWSYAHCRFMMNESEPVWGQRVARIEALEVEVEGETSYVAQPASPTYEALRDRIGRLRIDGKTTFQAATSHDASLRGKAYQTQLDYIDECKQDLFLELSRLLQSTPFATSADFKESRAALLAAAPQLRDELMRRSTKLGRPLHWYDLISTNLSPVDGWNDLRALEESRAIFASLSENWAATVDQLAINGRLEIQSRPHKRPGAFSMPMPVNQLPLCYVHAVSGRESVYGLVHELAHGVHFAAYRSGSEGSQLPASSVLELFPMTMELVACRTWEGHEAYFQKVVAATLFQLIFFEMRLRLDAERPKSLAAMQALWDSLCVEFFGSALAVDPGKNQLWLANRYLWSTSTEPQSYVTGGWLAWLSAERLRTSKVAAQELAKFQSQGTTDWLGEWKRALSRQ